uniref:RNA-binding protein NOB1 n=1 Tax=Anthurium amnicola TaxID=1678845 RepID=A0A1D1Y0W6_9ARAE
MEPPPAPPFPGVGGASCWSEVLQKKAPLKPQDAVPSRVFESCGSSKGVSVAVVDASAIVHGDKMASTVDRFVSVREVLEEVRDPVSRQRLSFLPFSIETMEPPPDAVKKVVKFARETGDLQTLSDVDIKLIALTYMLEAQIHGTDHLRSCPPPLQTRNVKNLPESEMPGWGSNVPNLEEWEALEQAEDNESNHGSRILPLKDLNLNVIPVNGVVSDPEEQEDEGLSSHKPKRSSPKKKETKIDGKKMVANGIDASQGEDRGNCDDWKPAVSRSTHRRYLRRKARRELFESSKVDNHADIVSSIGEGIDVPSDGESDSIKAVVQRNPGETHSDEAITARECDLSTGLEHMTLEDRELDTSFTAGAEDSVMADASINNMDAAYVENEDGPYGSVFDDFEISREIDRSIDTHLDDNSSEQRCTLQSMSDSSVACMTSDFAMQNVILQMGLRLLAPGGIQIHQLHKWVLKCHACNKVTTEIGRLFCPKCGNGGTLRKVSVTVGENGLVIAARRPRINLRGTKVSVTVGENGLVIAARRPRINLRGTKFSIPLPQGGRDAISKNFVLREDQVLHELLYRKQKKKNNKQDKDLFGEETFFHASSKKAPLKPPVGRAVLVFTGRRNPNDNHFTRKH